jgi:UDP-N-acetylmuramate dehydrogenase
LIPGSVGASPIQNIGAYGVEVKDVIEKVEVVDSVDFGIKTFDNLSCEFGYRNSIFKSKFPGRFVITNVFFRLKKSKNINTSYGAIKTELHQKGIENPTIKDVSDAVISIRKSKLPDPKLLGNAGSFFKNPIVKKVLVDEIAKRYPSVPFYEISNSLVKIPAGWLIETAGWKGFKENDYGVHEKQALVLVNYGKATGIEIYNLSQRIIEDIEAKFHIRLEREVNIL